MAKTSQAAGADSARRAPRPPPPPPSGGLSSSSKSLIRAKSLVARTAAARLMGVSPSTIANYQASGVLPAEQIEGVWYSSRAACLKLRAQREQESALVAGRNHAPVSEQARAGAVARSAFELLRQGSTAADLVTGLGCTPDEARKLATDFAELRELGGTPRAASFVACVKCGTNAARVCAGCAS